MATLSLIARRCLRSLERFAEETNELLLVIAAGLGGFYLSVQVILALASPPLIDDAGQSVPSRVECPSGAAVDNGFPFLPHRPR
jgi:hypothetical protein